MSIPPVLPGLERPRQVDRATLSTAVRAEIHELGESDGFDLAQVDLEWAELRSGWEAVVLDTPDGWILRFPRTEQIPFALELALLELLQDHLPAPIPQIVFVGRKTRFAVYPRLDGLKLEAAAFAAADPRTRDRVAADLGRFLVAMHAGIELSGESGLAVPAFDADGFFPIELARLDEPSRRSYQRIRGDVATRLAASPNPPVLLHNDFHTDNLVLDSALGRLAGVWDFSCVAVGDPSLDFRYLVEDGELGARVASAYAARTGQEIDLGLARDALRLEQVADALEEDRDPAPYLR